MMIRALILALLLVFSSVPVASVALADPPAVQSPQTNGILANIQNQYKTAATGWISAMQNAAKHIFQGLVAIELVWSFVWWTYEKGVDGFITSLLKKVMGLSFYWAIILNAPTWVPQIIATFGQIGATASNVSSLNPGNVFDLGIQIATQIAAAASKQASVTDPGTVAVALVSYIAALMVVLAFVVVALSLLITLIETYFVISAGMVLLGFAGSRWTSQFAEKYFSANVSVGLKLMMTYLVIGVGQSITTGWTSKISGSPAQRQEPLHASLAPARPGGPPWPPPGLMGGAFAARRQPSATVSGHRPQRQASPLFGASPIPGRELRWAASPGGST
ncbi:MAG: P-type conjugative transfer protein TrbL, partial [Methanobacterium sp.]|nr:P-type conjugative transfer protein TrbL [Methanobacterium sp.]